MSLFVAIPSYRDPECKHTIIDLFQKAENPDLIRVGVCNQIHPTEDLDLTLHDLPRKSQVRIKEVDCRTATGPCYARSITQSLWEGEEFYLQIDSHMRFVKGWDAMLKKYLSQTTNPDKSIITSYPVGYEQPNLVPSYKNACFLVAKGFGDDGMLRLDGKLLKQCLKEPKPSCFWVSGFAFSSSKVIQEVPYDPHLHYLFFGEEMLMGARLWTHGWDFYCPGESIIYHLWTRSYRKTFRETTNPERDALEQKSKERVCKIMGMKPLTSPVSTDPEIEIELSKYGLGEKRSLDDYMNVCGVDFQNRKIASKAKLGNLHESDFADPVLDMVMKSSPLVPLT
eukprot:Phypoly_transcript_04599.p1 GENE.Phypoly_transcript_04599~~Phypoly_transcript_04599.p1  ORF type:complete len:339 (+),score=34.76 Phypoly_transcript_04599:1063-2079(+)